MFLSNTSHEGLGGWCPQFNIMWRITKMELQSLGYIMAIHLEPSQVDPPDILHINVLEFIALTVNIWLALTICHACHPHHAHQHISNFFQQHIGNIMDDTCWPCQTASFLSTCTFSSNTSHLLSHPISVPISPYIRSLQQDSQWTMMSHLGHSMMSLWWQWPWQQDMDRWSFLGYVVMSQGNASHLGYWLMSSLEWWPWQHYADVWHGSIATHCRPNCANQVHTGHMRIQTSAPSKDGANLNQPAKLTHWPILIYVIIAKQSKARICIRSDVNMQCVKVFKPSSHYLMSGWVTFLPH